LSFIWYNLGMKMIYNEALDFICAAKRFADRNKPQDPDYPGLPEVEAWCRTTEEKLSPFLLNDLSLLVEKMIYPTLYFWFLVYDTPQISRGEELLDLVKNSPNQVFLSQLKKTFHFNDDTPPSVGQLEELIQDDGLFPGQDPHQEAELLYGFFQDPEDFQKRLHRTFLDFYHQAYLPGRKTLEGLGDAKFRWHQERLNAGTEDYLLSLGMKDFVRELLHKGEPTIYFSLFYDNELMVSWKKRTIIVGGATEQRVRSRSARDKTNTFLSCLGDAKRLEILRLTAQRPWYSTELARHFDVQPATLSYHMNKLVNADLINMVSGESRRLYYTLNTESVREYLEYVAQDLIGLNHDI